MKALILAYPYEAFTILTVIGALYHWIQKACKGEASFNPIEYWLKDTPGYTAGTLVALIAAWWFVVSNELLEAVKWQLVVGAGAMCGYSLNSGISKGSAADTAVRGLAPGAQGGFVLLRLLLPLLIATFVLTGTVVAVTGCTSGAVKSKNEAQALSYYTIGQAYDAVDAAHFDRKELSLETALALKKQIDLARLLLDISRDPKSADIQKALRDTVAQLATITVKGKPAISAAQIATVNGALNIAAQVTAGGTLPSTNDTGSWLLLGSEVLRAVGAASASQ